MTSTDSDCTTLFFLHFLGGSGRSWTEVAGSLPRGSALRTIDLPGFGDSAGHAGWSVSEMADHVADAVTRRAERGRFVLVGHSMGAKVAAVVARRAEDGEAGLEGLAGLVLVSGSPPGPEPIEDARRQDMLGWFAGGPDERHGQAERFVSANVAGPLTAEIHARTRDDVLRAHPEAWRAWLSTGSREDWGSRIGVLASRALIVAGARDEALGHRAQSSLMMPHFARARLVTLGDVGHLAPLERPARLASLIEAFVREGVAEHDRGAPVPAAYLDLIRSDRVSTRTRNVLLARTAAGDRDERSGLMDDALFEVFRAVLERVLPQPDGVRIDLAARIERSVADGGGDGWRLAILPPDQAALPAGVRTLDRAARERYGSGFVHLGDADKDALIGACADGTIAASGEGVLDARQMVAWFEELRALAVGAWVPHPATFAWLGHGGIAYGGDGPDKHGFRLVGMGQREDWEPVSAADRRAR